MKGLFFAGLALLCASQVLADRHCAAVVDYYFHTRAVILANEQKFVLAGSCWAERVMVVEQLEEASAEAEACGCAPLEQLTNAISAELEQLQGDCPAIQALLFAARPDFERRLRQCQ